MRIEIKNRRGKKWGAAWNNSPERGSTGGLYVPYSPVPEFTGTMSQCSEHIADGRKINSGNTWTCTLFYDNLRLFCEFLGEGNGFRVIATNNPKDHYAPTGFELIEKDLDMYGTCTIEIER